ncbi:MAG: hypothetical protein Q8N63_03345 [Nanoarchaeota archaeon]|nr:hypothetical protein [Nanoarchaeota archaeon]
MIKTTLKQKLGIGIVGLGLAGALFFGREHWKDNDNMNELEQQKTKEVYEPNELQSEYNKIFREGLLSGTLYTLSIATIFGGGTLILYDRLKKEWGKGKIK